MDVVDETEKLLARMTATEKAVMLRRVLDDLGGEVPGIERTPGVCGAAARIAGTRIPIWLLEEARRGGAQDADLLRAYPTLTTGDLTRAWAYVLGRGEEIDRLIRENEAA